MKRCISIHGGLNILFSVSQCFKLDVCCNCVEEKRGCWTRSACKQALVSITVPFLTHQCIEFFLFLSPFKIASFPRHPQGFAELP